MDEKVTYQAVERALAGKATLEESYHLHDVGCEFTVENGRITKVSY